MSILDTYNVCVHVCFDHYTIYGRIKLKITNEIHTNTCMCKIFTTISSYFGSSFVSTLFCFRFCFIYYSFVISSVLVFVVVALLFIAVRSVRLPKKFGFVVIIEFAARCVSVVCVCV